MGPSKRVITNKSEIPQTEDEKSNEQQQLLAPVKIKCVKCKTRFSRKGCCEDACLNCCSSMECEAHAESRVKQQYHSDLLQGNTIIARQANRDRSLALLPGAFRDSGFVYSEQTIKIWDIREFMANPRWREDAIRKSRKRTAREINMTVPRLKISRKRFHSLLDQWYHENVKTVDSK